MTAQTDLSTVESFKQKARLWAKDVLELVNTPVVGEMVKEKASLLKTASYIKRGIEGVFGTIDELKNAGLGVLPLIPIAVIGASLAAIYKWTLDYQTFKKKIEEQKRLEAKGVNPVATSKIVAGQRAPGFFNIDFKSPLTLVALAGGAWLLFGGRKDGSNS